MLVDVRNNIGDIMSPIKQFEETVIQYHNYNMMTAAEKCKTILKQRVNWSLTRSNGRTNYESEIFGNQNV